MHLKVQIKCYKEKIPFELNPLSASFTKWSNTLKQFVDNLPTNCLSVFDHFAGLAPKGLRAFRFVAIELLREHIEEMGSYDEMECQFSRVCKTSALAEHWINDFIKPLFLILLYVHAEGEGEFGLHLHAYKQIMPYFFAAGHFITILDMDCVTLPSWKNFQMKHLNLS